MQSIALSLLAGLPPVYGLYSVWVRSPDETFLSAYADKTAFQITCLVYACMGNSKQMSFGPETVASMLVGNISSTFNSCGADLSTLYSGLTIQQSNPADPAVFAHILAFMVPFH